MIDYESEDVRYLRKWLNEDIDAPIDRQALARVLASIWRAGSANMTQVVPTGWIPVTDRMPDEDADVLCWWDETFPAMVGLWNGRCWQDANGAMQEWDAPPVCWMPLPPLPPLPAPECDVKGADKHD